ncbi:MAG TPA: ADP-ribosylglycohydrolase family protein [Caldilineae bacterium]|nr:ADP-ribosylglycohydrolase family protein [Caldilineae bacterium]
MHLSYDRYLDQILGGWIGKSMGGAIGARFEGYKGWIEISPDEMFPDRMPPNDDLDLQILWLKVLEEKGAALTADDLAAAWLEWCWYPFNEYGIFRRNWRLGIHPPMSGRFTNQFWETGMGCPIRAEIWGYVFPGAPDLAARYATMDGSLDHTEQSIGAEKMLAAMASMAFFVPDVRRLAAMFIHYLPKDTPIERLTRAAFQAYDEGLSLRDARDRLMALAGIPEACDSQINVPFTFLALLYGGNDLQETLLAALRCGYDTDCTLATAGALIGQILGASRIPAPLKERIGDELVMGIQYRRPEMTLSALARDTARMGVLLAQECHTGVHIDGAPEVAPLPATARPPRTRLSATYEGLPAAAPGDVVQVTVHLEGEVPRRGELTIEGPPGWTIVPQVAAVDPVHRSVKITLHAPVKVTEWPMRNLFTARLNASPPVKYTFGIAGAGLWRLLGVYYDALPDENDLVQQRRRFNQHFVSLQRPYLPEPDIDVERLYREWSQKLGRPAVIPSYEHEIDLSRLVGLRGPYCAYLARTIISPEDRPVYIVIGNNDGYRLYLNGELIAEVDEYVWWAPFNNVHRAQLRQGPNHLLVKLLKRGDELKFTLGLRADSGDKHPFRPNGGHNVEDWLVDLADVVPE